MRPWDILLDLPPDLIHCVCGEWIDTLDLSALMVAVFPSSTCGPLLREALNYNSMLTTGVDVYSSVSYLQWLQKYRFHVETLRLSDSSALIYFGEDIYASFRHLQSLSIDNLGLHFHPGIMDTFLRLPKLQSLRLLDCYNNSSSGLFKDSATSSKTIHELRLNGSTLTPFEVVEILRHMPAIDNFGLERYSPFSDAIVQELGSFPSMRTLTLAGVGDLTNDKLSRLLHAFPLLQSLNVSLCMSLSDASMLSLSTHLHLQELRLGGLSHFSDSCFLRLLPTLHDLRVLDVSETAISERSFLAMASHCHHLQIVNVAHCHGFDDAALICLAEHCEHLEELSMTFCYRITDAGLLSVSSCCPLLRSLDLSSCGLVTDFALHAVAKKCKQLRSLNLSGLDQMTDNCLIDLVQSLHELQMLDISACTHLTDASFLAVALTCPQLVRLSVSDDPCITTLSIVRLKDSTMLPKLRFLDLSYCAALRSEHIDALHLSRPHLQILKDHVFLGPL